MKNRFFKATSLAMLVLSSSLSASGIISVAPSANLQVGEAFEYWVKSSGVKNSNVRYSLKSFPKGMRIDPKSGLLTWTPTLYQTTNSIPLNTKIILKEKGTQVDIQEINFLVNDGSTRLEELIRLMETTKSYEMVLIE